MMSSKYSEGFILDSKKEYFRFCGVDVMAFNDFYPAGHQSGLSIIMHGNRIATNGDLRFEQTPGQWQPLPVQVKKTLSCEDNSVCTHLHYPDMDAHLKGFNPMIYPDCPLNYRVIIQGEANKIRVRVDLEHPIPKEYSGKICFNLELFPAALFGRPWIMDDQQGIFPRQPNGPILELQSNYEKSAPLAPKEGIIADQKHLAGKGKGYSPIIADDMIAAPYACGHKFTLCPDDPYRRLTIESIDNILKLYDGRMNHNNGWFTVSSEVPADKTEAAVEWLITPHVEKEWRYPPVIQVSQVGYAPNQPKLAMIELDERAEVYQPITLFRIEADGMKSVLQQEGKLWGKFLRYNYLQFDFSSVTKPGLYQIAYGESKSCIFRIGQDVYDRGVWQPVLEYFLPVQMCHMRVNEKYRVWHGLCHNDDAAMAPVNYNHFDGYIQGSDTLTKYKSGDRVPGLNVGGWHDAGDYDLRIESQSTEIYKLALAYEAFKVDYDTTSIDQESKIVEIHQPDGKNDILQQIEHGALSIVAGYEALGRLYRGIICNDLRQYVLLGDGANMTDGIPGNEDDRWVFTEDNPYRELTTAAHLAAGAKALKGFNPELSEKMISIAKELFRITDDSQPRVKYAKVHASIELLIATGENEYHTAMLSGIKSLHGKLDPIGWLVARAAMHLNNSAFNDLIYTFMKDFAGELEKLSSETPYGIPYRPHIWGAGWDIQRKGAEYYFLHKAFPDLFAPDFLFNSLNFILGCHPGSNTASFASGVGAHSATTAYGANRADFSYIPGGVVSGTALIRPDFPELLEWPFLWQQTEYVLGGGSSDYMFLVLAVKEILKMQ